MMSQLPESYRRLTEVDRLIHEPTRFVLMSLLSVVKRVDFVLLLRQTALSNGNLSSHMSKLEEASYIEVEKTFEDKRPRTTYALTSKGREAYAQYHQIMGDALATNIP